MRRSPILAAALCALLLTHPARADLVTPGAVGVPPDVVVTDQYRGLGLVFHSTSGWDQFNTPIGTRVQGGWWGLDLWDHTMSQSAEFVVPGTDDPATTDTLRLEIASAFRSRLTVDAFGIDGRLVRSFSMITEGGWVGQWVTLRGPGIHSFTADEHWWDPPGQEPDMYYNSPGWHINAVEFQPVAVAPEPGTLALFALGAAGLLARRFRGGLPVSRTRRTTPRRPASAGGNPPG